MERRRRPVPCNLHRESPRPPRRTSIPTVPAATTITHTVTNPPTASISGPTSVLIYTAGECVNVSWTASATGGSPGYTYTWYLGTSTTAAGTGSTLTKQFCGAQTINVKVIARDTAAQTDDATYTTTIRRERIVLDECGGGICP